jgi:peptidyl-prolyl cis-trans isomerase B (cyclophilin B)
MDAVNAIKGVQTGGRHGHQDVPVQDVIIEQAIVLE